MTKTTDKQHSDQQTQLGRFNWKSIREGISKNWHIVLGLLIAIGAYSNESILVKIVKNDPIFTIGCNTVLSSIIPNGMIGLIKHETAFNGTVLRPVSLFLRMDIGNHSDESRQIKDFRFYLKNEKDEWERIYALPTYQGLYVPTPSKYLARRIKHKGISLADTLDTIVVKPNEVITGWFYIEQLNRKLRGNLQNKIIKVIVVTKFNEEEDIDIDLKSIPGSYNELFLNYVTRINDSIDVRNYKILHYADIDKLGSVGDNQLMVK